MRVVLDTNIVVSHTLAPRGLIDAIFGYWLRSAFDLIVSEALLEEYEAALKKPYIQAHHHKSDAAIATLIKRFRTLAIVVTPTQRLTVVPNDPDDNKIIECAASGNADYIVTGDAHLLAIKAYQGIQILTPALFVTILEQAARKKAA